MCSTPEKIKILRNYRNFPSTPGETLSALVSQLVSQFNLFLLYEIYTYDINKTKYKDKYIKAK